MNREPIPRNSEFDQNPVNAGPYARSDTSEGHLVVFARNHPVLTLLAIYPVYAVFTAVAPAIALGSKDSEVGRARVAAGYNKPKQMAAVAWQELARRRQVRRAK